MIDRLRSLHDAVLRGIEALEALTADSEPRVAEVSAARLALSKASRARTAFLEISVYPVVEPLAPTTIAGLRVRGRERQLASSEHVHRWTVAELQRHWSEYCDVSNTVRAGMRIRIREEQALLYPLIEVAQKAA